jgi:hypothetical protein
VDLKSTLDIIQSLDVSLNKLFLSFINFDINKIISLGSALKVVGEGLNSLSGTSILKNIGSIFTGDPIEKLERLAATSDKILVVSVALQSISSALSELSVALNNLDTSKLETLNDITFNRPETASFSPIASSIAEFNLTPINPLSAETKIFKQQENKIDMTPIANAVAELKNAVANISNRPISLKIDGQEMIRNNLKNYSNSPA